jgi:large subunit ribosomal protein L2
MGKRLTVQRRGKGSPMFRSPSHKHAGRAAHPSFKTTDVKGTVAKLLHCSGHTAPLMMIKWETGEKQLTVAPEGIRMNDTIEIGAEKTDVGCTLQLKDIPEGTLIYNIESIPGDGGKFARASGVFAKVLAKQGGMVSVMLPSKKQKKLNLTCRATVGVVAGGGRPEKPLLKAGTRFFKNRSRAKVWPVVCGQSQNAVEHPHGGAQSSHKNKPDIARRFAPAGAKIGKIRPKRTGRKR